MKTTSKRTGRHTRLVAIMIASIGFGCGDDSGGPSVDPPDTPRSDEEFIDALWSHHEDAISIAGEVIARGASPEIQDLAGQMRDDYAADNDEMQRIYERVEGGDVDRITDERVEYDLETMQEMSGDDLDRRFVADMIPHQAVGIVISHRALPNLQEPQLRSIAEEQIAGGTVLMSSLLQIPQVP